MKEHVRRKYEEDLRRTQEEIEECLKVASWSEKWENHEGAEQERKNARRREIHLQKLQEKLRN